MPATLRLDGHGGFDAGDAAANLGRINPVLKHADADHVEMRLGQVEKAAAVAKVAILDGDAAGRHGGEHFVEAGQLLQRESFVQLVGHRKMAHHAFEFERFVRANGLGPAAGPRTSARRNGSCRC